MNSIQFNDLKQKLVKTLNKERYEHTIGVMYTAASLAMAYEYPMGRAMLAGLLHDCAKCIPYKKMILLCEGAGCLPTESELNNPSLLHAKAGAIVAKQFYDIHEEEILHAIMVHTTGAPDMTLLDKIIYVSDYIEPGRSEAPNLSNIRKLAYQDINQCVAQIAKDTLFYLESKKCVVDPMTQLTYECYRQYKED